VGRTALGPPSIQAEVQPPIICALETCCRYDIFRLKLAECCKVVPIENRRSQWIRWNPPLIKLGASTLVCCNAAVNLYFFLNSVERYKSHYEYWNRKQESNNVLSDFR